MTKNLSCRIVPALTIAFFFLSLCPLDGQNFKGLITPVNNRDYYKNVLPLIEEAEESILVIMYLASYYAAYPDSPTNILLRQMAASKNDGLRVEMIFNQSQRQYTQQTSTENLKTAVFMANRGVPVYFDSHEKTTHNKLIIIDGKYVVIGSANWTYSAMDKNNESSVIIDSRELAEFYTGYFEDIKAECSVYLKPADSGEE